MVLLLIVCSNRKLEDPGRPELEGSPDPRQGDLEALGAVVLREALELVQVAVIRSVRFLSGARATALFGAGHTQGVIHVLTQD